MVAICQQLIVYRSFVEASLDALLYGWLLHFAGVFFRAVQMRSSTFWMRVSMVFLYSVFISVV